MTIPVSALEAGAWYDGFMKKGDRQIGVITLQWSGSLELFYNPVTDPSFHYWHVDDPRGTWGEWAFEPNVVSTPEHK